MTRRNSDHPAPTPQPTPCRIWQGTLLAGRGYGLMYRPELKRNVRVTRWVWQQVHGPITPDVKILHRCDNPPCFRYDHLFAGTDADNHADMMAKGRQARRWTDDEVREIRRRHAAGESQRTIAADLGVPRGAVQSALNNWTWLT